MSRFTHVGRIGGAGPVIGLRVEEGRYAEVQEIPEESGDAPLLSPGFCDVQINGYAGVDFNQEAPLERESVRRATEALWAEGCTTFLPTLITNEEAVLERRFRELNAAREADAHIAASVLGYHLEGPFVSPLDGARGAHDRRFVQAPDGAMLRRLRRAAADRIKIVTLSPEWDGAEPVIATLCRDGIRVSIGHTMASPEQIRSAVRVGASLVTHFGNGVPATVPRHPNVLWEQLASDGLSCLVISDGFHLPDAVLTVAFRMKGRNAFVTSDATAFGGMEPGTYTAPIGGRVTLTPEGRLHLTNDPVLLAGSAQSIRHGVEYLVRRGVLSSSIAMHQASTAPAQFVDNGLDADIRVGAFANLVEYRWDHQTLHIEKTWLHGQLVYSSERTH